ncbi:MAG: glycosyltransferase family 4 protein [Oscillospiraceae bacterium]|nr:glycosyltransferase family 4 protein [Oscillospiraceae bacterium]
MLVVLAPGYPSPKNPSFCAFVHSRILSYRQKGTNAVVFILNDTGRKTEYEYEGVTVYHDSPEEFARYVEQNGVTHAALHFINERMIRALSLVKEPMPVFIFVHGLEALLWHERIFPGLLRSPRLLAGFVKGAFVDTHRIYAIRRFLRETQHRCRFITVSEWMKEKAVKNWRCSGASDDWSIIPNIVREERFPYREKSPDMRFRFLTIRSFDTGKYANDLTVKIILALRDHPRFAQMHFTIYGKGRLFQSTLAPLRGLENVEIHESFINNAEIAQIHAQNGIFLCPTRQDAQGVSMCEAMSSGLVPVTLYNTAIPEYLPKDGRLACRDLKDMTALARRLIDEPETFAELSALGSCFIREKCSAENTTEREQKLFAGM